MPIYEYRCRDCDEELEVRQAFTDDPLTECPACSGDLRKLFSTPGIAFKGSGFYKTDSRSGGSGSSGSGSSTTKSDTGGSDSTSTGSDSKSDSSSSNGSGSTGGSSSEGSSTTPAKKPASTAASSSAD